MLFAGMDKNKRSSFPSTQKGFETFQNERQPLLATAYRHAGFFPRFHAAIHVRNIGIAHFF